MPNWCNNEVEFVGDVETISALYQQVKETKEFLQCIHPVPTEIIKGDGECTAFQWRCDNWDTKWEVDEFFFKQHGKYSVREDGKAVFSIGYFETAWCAPHAAYEAYKERNPGVEIRALCWEPGMQFGCLYDTAIGRTEYHDAFIDFTKITVEQMENPSSGAVYEVSERFGVAEEIREWQVQEALDNEVWERRLIDPDAWASHCIEKRDRIIEETEEELCLL